MSDSNNNGFQRWQGITIAQMSYVINTFLIITMATVGFSISQLLAHDYYCCICPILIGISFLLLCILFIVILIINRLMDFRITTQIRRKEDKNELDGIEQMRGRSTVLGTRTWSLFYISIGLFLVGEILIIAGFAYVIISHQYS